jgi:hypothetical protein
MADTENEDLKKGKKQKIEGLRVTSRTEGFRRAGRAWSQTPIELPSSDFTDEQIEALKADPMLVVEIIELSDK